MWSAQFCPMHNCVYCCCVLIHCCYIFLHCWHCFYTGCCNSLWVTSRRCGCFVTWFCYQLIAKPGNKIAASSWPDSYQYTVVTYYHILLWHISVYCCYPLSYTYSLYVAVIFSKQLTKETHSSPARARYACLSWLRNVTEVLPSKLLCCTHSDISRVHSIVAYFHFAVTNVHLLLLTNFRKFSSHISIFFYFSIYIWYVFPHCYISLHILLPWAYC